MPNDKAPVIDYAAAPRSMTRARLAYLIGGISGATILIAGTAYELVGATTRPVIMGDLAPVAPVIQPTSRPCMPGGVGAPTTMPIAPATQPVEK